MKAEDVGGDWLVAFSDGWARDGVRGGIAAVAPLIAVAERERAAKMVEEYGCHNCEMDAELAAAIRARSDAP